MQNLFPFLMAILVAGCAQPVVVKEIRPVRAGFETKPGMPSSSLESHLDAAAVAWKKLETKPSDATALGDYNFAVAASAARFAVRNCARGKLPSKSARAPSAGGATRAPTGIPISTTSSPQTRSTSAGNGWMS